MLSWVGTAGYVLGTGRYKVLFDGTAGYMLSTAGYMLGTAGYMVSYRWMAQLDICMAQPDIWWMAQPDICMAQPDIWWPPAF